MAGNLVIGSLGRVLMSLALAAFATDSASLAYGATLGEGEQSPALTLVSSPPKGYWARYRLNAGDRVVDIYIAHDVQPKPVLVLIQGSGCTPLMTVDPDGTFHDTTLFQDFIPSRLRSMHFVLVGKRGVQPLRFSVGMSQQQKIDAFQTAEHDCSPEYLRNVTKQSRVDDIVAIVRSLASQPWAQEIMLAGHSEGTLVATGALHEMKDSEVTAAALF